ncbi:permease-like cell division protein FtsX [Teredinibacter waterburyi]|jgi:cell division protein FtsX|uniref:permease-like cell division protein FtsX n=1 Tax=Teredinibacter waterburyi TaxID=1500538 RepID=UPI00165FB727|nr:permease-like cell division protein FtsX [Teredinibacter waterburyi]
MARGDNSAKHNSNKAQTTKVQPSKGAVQTKTSLRDRFRAYRGHHRASFSDSLSRLLRTPMQTLMTALVVAIALALPATLLVALGNIQQLGESWDASPKISVYLHLRASDEAISQLVQRLERLPEVRTIEYLSADKALQQFQQMSGFGDVIASLDSNPLPATLIVTPSATAIEPEALKLLGQKLAEEAIVDEVSLDMDWVRRLRELMVLGKKIVAALAGLLGLGVLLVIGNTVRLAIENRRDEIVVVKLVGGTDGYVRRPFLYTGAWYGFMGGVLACIIVAAGYLSLHSTVSNLAMLYQSDFSLQGLGLVKGSLLLGASTLIGLLGAWLAVGRHLAQIEP